MKFTNKLPTAAKSKDQEAIIKSNIGTVLILISGLVLYADKIVDYFDIQVGHIEYYGSLDVFLWTIAGTVSPLLLVMGYFFNPHKWALAAPVTAYSIQLMYIFRDVEWIGKDYFWIYTIITILSIAALIYFLKNYASTITSLKSKIRYIMNKIILDAPDYVKDEKKWDEEIIEPTLDKLNE